MKDSPKISFEVKSFVIVEFFVIAIGFLFMKNGEVSVSALNIFYTILISLIPGFLIWLVVVGFMASADAEDAKKYLAERERQEAIQRGHELALKRIQTESEEAARRDNIHIEELRTRREEAKLKNKQLKIQYLAGKAKTTAK
jgi:hypothetical protein